MPTSRSLPGHPRRGRLVVGAAVACLALAVPPAASAAWQRLGPAPGGQSFAVIGGTPYVAYTSSKGVRVSRYAGATVKWRSVGGAVRHGRHNSVASPSLAAGPNGKVWLTWTEGTRKTGKQVRVARFTGGRWREVVGGKDPISQGRPDPQDPSHRKVFGSSEPSLGFFRGRPYAAYVDYDGIDTMVRVARLGSGGHRWKDVLKGLGTASVLTPKLASAGGRLFLEFRSRTFQAPLYARFDAASSSWKSLPLAQSGDSALFGGMIGFKGRLNTLFAERPDGNVFVSQLGTDNKWTHVGPAIAIDPSISPQSIATDGSTLFAAYVQTVQGVKHIDVFFFRDPSWFRTSSPTPAGSTVSSGQLAGAVGGGVWLLARESSGGKATFQLELNNAAE